MVVPWMNFIEITIETDLLARTHGSALFQRGMTKFCPLQRLVQHHLSNLLKAQKVKKAKDIFIITSPSIFLW